MNEEKKEIIKITHPEPYQGIGSRFVISGYVPVSWLKTNIGLANRISLEILDIEGDTMIGTSVDVPPPTWLSKFRKRIWFSDVFQLHALSGHFIKESQGRITIKLSGENKQQQSIFIPLIVKEFEPKQGADPKIIAKHGRVGEIVRQYEKDLKNYYKELEEINASRRAKDEDIKYKHFYGISAMKIGHEIFKILEESDEDFHEYTYNEEDRREQELENKYKKALDWRGPLLRGLVSQFNGFEIRVNSDDHDNHFHVIHRGKGVNARFSFPEMQLINYVNSRNTIGSKQEKKIRECCSKPDIFKIFEKEFQKRSQTQK